MSKSSNDFFNIPMYWLEYKLTLGTTGLGERDTYTKKHLQENAKEL